MDLKYGVPVGTSPESALHTAAKTQMCQYYGLPFQASAGSASPAVELDMQAGYDKGISILFSVLSGGGVRIGSALGASKRFSRYELPVIQNEIAGMMYRLLRRGFEVNPDTLAVPVIREVGPGGHFLNHRHTRENYKLEEAWQPRLSNRLTRDEYEEKGAVDLLARARAEVKRILATHHPKPLDKDVQRKLQQIVDEAED